MTAANNTADHPTVTTFAILQEALHGSDAWQKYLPEPISITFPVTAIQTGGKDWNSDDKPDKIYWSDIHEGSHIAGKIGFTRDNLLYVKDDGTGRLFRIALKDIVGPCLEAIEAYDKHATCACVARLWIEKHRPEEKDMIEAAKLVELGRTPDAIEKYGEPAMVTLIAYGQAVLGGRIDDNGNWIDLEETEENEDTEDTEKPVEAEN